MSGALSDGPVPGPDDRSREVGRRATSGLGWVSLSGIGQSVLQVVVLAVLARHVSPTEFGIASAGLVVMGLTWIFTEAGVGKALVQRPEIDERHVRVAFSFQVTVSVLLWLALWAGAGLIAAVFAIPELVTVAPAITFGLVVNSLTLGDFLLQRDLAFKKVAGVQFVSWSLGYGLVAIVLAVMGFGVWAIVVGNVTQIVLRVALLWWLRPHAVRPLWDREVLGQLLFFGGGYTLGWWANFVARQGDNFVVGRWLGAEALGLYSRAYSLMRQPASLFGKVVGKVLFPALSAVQHDIRRLRANYLRSVSAIALVVVPFTLVARLLSTEVITVLLGERWLGMQAAFEVMVLGMLFRTSSPLSDAVTTAAGAVYARAGRQMVYAVLVVGGAVVGQRWGIEGVALGLLLALAVNFGLMAHLGLKVTEGRWSQFARAHLLGAVLGVAAAAPTVVVARVLRGADAPALVVLTTATLLAALVCGLLLRAAPALPFARPVVDELLDVLRVLGPRSAPRRAVTAVLGPSYAAPRRGAPAAATDAERDDTSEVVA